MYIPQLYGDGTSTSIGDPSLLVGALGEVRPDAFFGVPRVWEKIQTGLRGLLAMEPDADKQGRVEGAMAGRRRSTSSRSRSAETDDPRAPGAVRRGRRRRARRPIKAMLGLDRVTWAGCASAPMPIEVARFFAGLGLAIYDIYGHDRDLRRRHRLRARTTSGSAPSAAPPPASSSRSATTARC